MEFAKNTLDQNQLEGELTESSLAGIAGGLLDSVDVSTGDIASDIEVSDIGNESLDDNNVLNNVLS